MALRATIVDEHWGDRQGAHVKQLTIHLEALTPAERRDLSNALLRAAWAAALEQTRILLLDLVVEADDVIPFDA